jgi:hypothetical protein
MHGTSCGHGRTTTVVFYTDAEKDHNLQDCNDTVTAKFFSFTLPDGKQVPLCEVSRRVATIPVHLVELSRDLMLMPSHSKGGLLPKTRPSVRKVWSGPSWELHHRLW